MRTSSKLVVVDPAGRVLLLDCVDPGAPATTWWELPGGGVEEGEDAATAAVREVLEETGVVVPPACVGPLLWTQRAAFTWRQRRHLADHEARVARLPGPPELAESALTDVEQGSILGQRWWTPEEVAAHDGRFFPRSLPTLLPRLLAGERVDEPDDDWDIEDADVADADLPPGPA